MFTRTNKDTRGSFRPRAALLLLGGAAVATLGYMGYATIEAAYGESPLDLDALASENAAEWGRLAQLDGVLDTMSEHYDRVVAQFSDLSELQGGHAEKVRGMVTSLEEDGELTSLADRPAAAFQLSQKPRTQLYQVARFVRMNAINDKQTVSVVQPKHLQKALKYMDANKSFLTANGIDIQPDLDALAVATLKFKHITMELSAIAGKVQTQSASIIRMVDLLRKSKDNESKLKKVWRIAYKKFITILKESKQETNKIVADLKAIDHEMNRAINNLEQAKATAFKAYQKDIDHEKKQVGIAQLKIKQLQKDYVTKNHEAFPFKMRSVAPPWDPRKLRHICDPNEVVRTQKVYRTDRWTTGAWFWTKHHSRTYVSHVIKYYRNCAGERRRFDAINNNQWLRNKAAYNREVAAATNLLNNQKAKWTKERDQALKAILRQQYLQEEKEAQSTKKILLVTKKQDESSKNFEIIIQYQKSIQSSLKQVLYMAMKFEEVLGASINTIVQTSEELNPASSKGKSLNTQDPLFHFDTNDESDPFGENIPGLEGILEDSDFGLFLALVRGDVVDIKDQSMCTKEQVDHEVKCWAYIAEHPNTVCPITMKLSPVCTQLSGALSADDADSDFDPFVI